MSQFQEGNFKNSILIEKSVKALEGSISVSKLNNYYSSVNDSESEDCMNSTLCCRGSREAVHQDVENELREAMSDTIKEEGKALFCFTLDQI